MNDPTPGVPGCGCPCHRVAGITHPLPCCNPDNGRVRGDGGPEPAYGTTHATTDDRLMATCCSRPVADLGPHDVLTTTDAEVTCPGPNPPLPDEVVWSGAEHHKGHPWLWMGEDGDAALMRGHVERQLLVDALESGDLSSGFYESAEVRHGWLLAHEHQEGCRDNLEANEGCNCDEFGWWGSTFSATAETPGALPVTIWSM